MIKMHFYFESANKKKAQIKDFFFQLKSREFYFNHIRSV